MTVKAQSENVHIQVWIGLLRPWLNLLFHISCKVRATSHTTTQNIMWRFRKKHRQKWLEQTAEEQTGQPILTGRQQVPANWKLAIANRQPSLEDELASYVLSKPLYQLIMSTSVKNGCKELSKEVGQSVTSTLSTKDDTERQLFNIELSPPSDKENYYSKCRKKS